MLADSLHKPRGPSPQRGRSTDLPGSALQQFVCLASGFPIDSCASFSRGLIAATKVEQGEAFAVPCLALFTAICPKRRRIHLEICLSPHLLLISPPKEIHAAPLSPRLPASYTLISANDSRGKLV